MRQDPEGYEIRTYRVKWYFRIGTWGDSEGRTWAKELICNYAFPTKEAAELHRQHHPDCFQDPWGGWRHRKSYHHVGIFRVEELIEE